MRIILTLLFLALHVVSISAAKAYPGLMPMVQPDGTVLNVRMLGDEFFHWYTTDDNVLLFRQGNAFFVAATAADGSLSSTTLIAHNAGARGEREQIAAARQNRELFMSHAASCEKMRSAEQRSDSYATTSVYSTPPFAAATPSYFPHSGQPVAVVVLVQFDDVKFTVSDPQEVFDQYLNADELSDFGHAENANFGSVARYFEDMSFGQFRPQFDVFAPVTLSKEMAYYGQNSSSTIDLYFDEFLSEAAALADDYINFGDERYDADGDGYVDLVYFIYAGYGESNGAGASTIWPKSGTRLIGTLDGKKVSRYGVNNELNMYPGFTPFDGPQINGIGLFCHEFSHTMGLPDLYPTVASACVDNQEMEYWSVMDAGEYVYYGYYPTAYTAWEREAMGWTSIEPLTENSSLQLIPVSSGGQAYKFSNPEDDNDFMVMENIQNTGWNLYLPGHGLLVYHVCWPYSTIALMNNPNNTAYKPGMAVVPADGLLISSYNNNYTTSQYRNSHKGDPFPGTSSVTYLSAEQQLPNYTWYSNTPTVAQGLTNIEEAEGLVTLSFVTDYASGIMLPNESNSSNQGTRIYNLAGQQQNPNNHLRIYINTHKHKTIEP